MYLNEIVNFNQIVKESGRLILIGSLLLSSGIFAQENSQVEFNLMRSMHGTGDLSGFNFSSSYINPINNKLSYVFSIGGSTHSGDQSLFFTIDDRNIDSSILYTTSGMQIGFGLDYKFITSKKHRFHFRFTPILRYQSTSIPDVSTVLFPPLTELPFPVISFELTTPPETLAVGLDINPIYNFKINSTFSLNLIGSFQFDSNGDTMRGFGLGVVKSL